MIAEDGGRIVGAVGLELYGTSALLRSAAVEESWQGCGVGRSLIDRALVAPWNSGKPARHRP